MGARAGLEALRWTALSLGLDRLVLSVLLGVAVGCAITGGSVGLGSRAAGGVSAAVCHAFSAVADSWGISFASARSQLRAPHVLGAA